MEITKLRCVRGKSKEFFPNHQIRVSRHAEYICKNCYQIFSGKPAYVNNYLDYPISTLKDSLKQEFGEEKWEKEWFKLKVLKPYLWKYMGKIEGDIFSYNDIFKD